MQNVLQFLNIVLLKKSPEEVVTNIAIYNNGLHRKSASTAVFYPPRSLVYPGLSGLCVDMLVLC